MGKTKDGLSRVVAIFGYVTVLVLIVCLSAAVILFLWGLAPVIGDVPFSALTLNKLAKWILRMAGIVCAIGLTIEVLKVWGVGFVTLLQKKQDGKGEG